MLDAGRARECHRDKSIPEFESSAIRKLLRSPDYIGRYYSYTYKGHEKYVKNKQICDLIDNIRYKKGSKKYIRDSAILHYKGYPHTVIDGGTALITYGPFESLDLGNAYPPQRINGDLPGQFDIRNPHSSQGEDCDLKKQFDLGNAYPHRVSGCDLGNAYPRRLGKCDLGNAYPPQGTIVVLQGNSDSPGELNLGNSYPC